MQRDEQADSQVRHHPRFVVEGFQEIGRSFVRGDDPDRMGVEGQQPGEASFPFRGVQGSGDHGLVADVDAIEDTERQVQWHAQRRQIFKGFANQHGAGIGARWRWIKPWGCWMKRNAKDGENAEEVAVPAP